MRPTRRFSPILKLRDEIDRRISVLVQAGVRAGQFDVDDPLVATRAITGMISFMWTWAHNLDSNAAATLAKQMTRIAMRTLQAGDEANERSKR